MQHQPRPPFRTSRALERHRKLRRRQLAAVAGVGGLVVALVVVIAGIVLVIRTCSYSTGPGSRPADTDLQSLNWAEELAAFDLRPAPWFCELDGDSLYTATDMQRRETGYLSYPLDTLTAYALETREQRWQQPVDAEFSGFYFSGQRLVGFRQYLADEPRIVISSYGGADGAREWQTTIEGAAGGCITADGNVMILGYRLEDGYRLAAYNLETEAKAWGMLVPLEGQITQDLASDITQELNVRGWPGVVTYQLYNVIGLVASGRGERLREFAATGYIFDYALDLDDGRCYLLLRGNQEGTYRIQSLAISGSGSRELHNFVAADGVALMRAHDGVLALCCNIPVQAGDPPRARIVCLRAETREVVQEMELPGIVSSLVLLPDRSGDMLLAVNQRIEDNGSPAGWGRLWRIPLSGGEIQEVGRFRQAVLGIAPFKDDCLVLLRGGDIYSFVSATNARRRIRRSRYDFLDWLSSQDGETLAVLSTPPDYLADQPGQPMQVIVYH